MHVYRLFQECMGPSIWCVERWWRMQSQPATCSSAGCSGWLRLVLNIWCDLHLDLLNCWSAWSRCWLAGPLTSEYYDQLSARLGDEWVRLANGLGLGQPAIHRIVRSHAHLDDSAEITRRSAREVLVQWHRSSVKFPGKVSDEIVTLYRPRSQITFFDLFAYSNLISTLDAFMYMF